MNRINRNSDKLTFDEQLINEAALKNSIYNYSKIEPSIFFWKELISSTAANAPSILVPDTLVLNEKNFQIAWIYTNPTTGKLCKQFNTSYKDFITKITNYTSPNELVAILKRPIFQQQLGYVNQFKLFNSKYLQNCSQQQIVTQKNQIVCLQKYIKCSGSKAFICRTIFEKNCASTCYLLTSKNTKFYSSDKQNKDEPNDFKRFTIKSSNSKQTNCIKSKTGTNLQETLKYLKEIQKYMKFVKGVELLQIVGDFIKDESNNWWLVNIKAFKIKEKIVPVKDRKMADSELETAFYIISQGNNNKVGISEDHTRKLEKERYQKTKMCRYCQKNYLQPELTHKLTMKMIIQVDKYLVHMGKWDKWLKRSDITNVDAHCLYQEHKVCQRCYRLYSEIQLLLKTQGKFLKKLGYFLENSPKQMIINQTNEEELWNQSKNKEIHRLSSQIPQIIELGPNTNITTIDNRPFCNDQIINKMIRFRFIIFLNQIDEVVQLGEGVNYYLELTALQKKVKYKLDTSLLPNSNSVYRKKLTTLNVNSTQKSCRNMNFSSSEPLNLIPLKKLKVFYFFANSMEQVEQYAKSGATIQINLIIETRTPEANPKNPLVISQVSSFSKKTSKESVIRMHNLSVQDDNIQRKVVGKLNLELKDFISFSPGNSKKDFYKLFDVQGVPYGWGLEGSIGIIPSESYVNTSRIIFSKIDKEIYLPNENYYYCQYLPEEWINHIKAKHEQSKRYYSYKQQGFLGMTNQKISSKMIKNTVCNVQMKRKERKPSAFLESQTQKNRVESLQRENVKNTRIVFKEGSNPQIEDASQPQNQESQKNLWKQFLNKQIFKYEKFSDSNKPKANNRKKLHTNKENY